MLNNKGTPPLLVNHNNRFRRYYHLFRARLDREDQGFAAAYWPASLALWIVILIGTPIAVWSLGEQVFPHAATLGVLMQSVSVVLALLVTWPVERVALSVVTIAIVAFGAEVLGVHYGIPFGRYEYTDALAPQIMGVPILISLAWVMMLAPSWAVAWSIMGILILSGAAPRRKGSR